MNRDDTFEVWLEDEMGARYPVLEAEGDIRIGRALPKPGDTTPRILIHDIEATAQVSREHALLRAVEAGVWEISDAGSRFGLIVNGRKVEGDQSVRIAPGAEIRLGDYALRLRAGDMARASETRDADATATESGSVADTKVPFQGATGGEHFYLDTFLDGQLYPIAIPLKKGATRWTIGRAREREDKPGAPVHVTVPNAPAFQTVSRKHALLTREPGAPWRIASLSKQGTMVNDRRLAGEDETVLEPGDKVVMGSAVFVFRSGAESPTYDPKTFEFNPAEARKTPRRADDQEITRELPAGFYRVRLEGEAADAWGVLVENTLDRPQRFYLRKRVTRVGSHPLNSDVQMDDPGIDDLFAVIRARGSDVIVQSKSHETPVRVDHVVYRTSPPLEDGSIISFGSREFRLKMLGTPPEAMSAAHVRRLQQTVALLAVAIVVLSVATIGGYHYLSPKSARTGPPVTQDWEEIAQDVVQYSGLETFVALQKGLEESLLDLSERKAAAGRIDNELARDQALGAIRDEQNAISELQGGVVQALRAAARAHRLIHKSSDEDMRRQFPAIRDALDEARKVFAYAYLSPDLANQGWFKELEDAFVSRRETAFAQFWEMLLSGLSKSNMDEARNALKELAPFEADDFKVRQAKRIVREWEEISPIAKALEPTAIVDGYVERLAVGTGRDFLAEEKEKIDQLAGRFRAISGDTSKPAQALVSSSRWKTQYENVLRVSNAVTLLAYYRLGEEEEFEKYHRRVARDVSRPFLAQIDANMREWGEWQRLFARRPHAYYDYEVFRRAIDLQKQIAQTVDADSPFLVDVTTKVDNLRRVRRVRAEELRAKAKSSPDGEHRLLLLLEAYELDPGERAGLFLQKQAVEHFGELNRLGAAAVMARRDGLLDILARYVDMEQKGALGSNYDPARQLKQLLKKYGIKTIK